MTSRDFVYWLMGFFEITGTADISPKQAEMIKRHLALVFKREIDPAIDGGDAKLGAALQALNDGFVDQRPTPPVVFNMPSGVPLNDSTPSQTLYRC